MKSSSRSWSIYNRAEITQHYEIMQTIGSGSYSDVYKARRLSDNLIVALKEIHDYQSAFREIEALQALQNCPHIVNLIEYFWQEDEDAVLVLEYLRTDLGEVIKEAKRNRENGITLGEIKRWMIQILLGVDACHRNSIVHRDLKPANLLINDDAVLKLADFGQARILVGESNQHEQNSPKELWPSQPAEDTSKIENAHGESSENRGHVSEEEYMQELDDVKDGEASCLATCATSDMDMEDDPLKSSYSYGIDGNREDGSNTLTSYVGTRWFKAPELLYGSTQYGLEIDLWSMGCIFAELLKLEPLFPGASDIDQLFRIINVLGNLTEEVWPGCSNLPDYGKIFFEKIERPLGLEGCLPNHSNEIGFIQKLVCYNPEGRATAMELLNDKYFHEVPLPVAPHELRIPLTSSNQDGISPGEWFDYKNVGEDSDLEEFGDRSFNISTTGTDYSIRFS